MTASFAASLELEYIDGHNWLLTAAFTYLTDVGHIGAVHVPAGFVTDFASVPKVLWNLLPPTGSYGKAAVIHDFLYRTDGAATRAEADAILLEAMAALGVGWWTRRTIYYGVRIGGHWSYKGGL